MASGEIILIAGANYPIITQTSKTLPIYRLEHGLDAGKFLQLCLRYAKAAAERQPECVFTLFDFYTGAVAKFTSADIKKMPI
jgi:hypothetical protein